MSMTPMTRVELFLAAIAGEEYTTPDPMTRIEVYLDCIEKGTAATLVPMTRIELYLAKISGADVDIPPYPMTRIEMFLAALCDEDITPPEAMTRIELYLAKWIESKHDTNLMDLSLYHIAAANNYNKDAAASLNIAGTETDAAVTADDAVEVQIKASNKGVVFYSLPLEPGKEYTYSHRIKSTDAATTRRSLYFVDDDFMVVSREKNWASIGQDETYVYTGKATCPEGATMIAFCLISKTGEITVDIMDYSLQTEGG